MEFAVGAEDDEDAIVDLFAAVFTASEGAEEGKAIGRLARDLITGQTWAWGSHNYIRHDPTFNCAHAVVLERMP